MFYQESMDYKLINRILSYHEHKNEQLYKGNFNYYQRKDLTSLLILTEMLRY